MTQSSDKAAKPTPRAKNNPILWLLTWIAIVAIASYTVWQKQETDHTESAHMVSMVDTLKSQEQVLSTLTEIVKTHDQQFQQVAQHSNELAASVKSLKQQLHADDRTWRIMQINSYIEQAVLQANVMHDSTTAKNLLSAAEYQLQQLDDPKLSALQDAIKNDKQALEQALPADKNSLIAAINAVILNVPELPQKAFNNTENTEAAQQQDEKNWQDELKTSWRELKSLVQVRKGGELLTPHISKDQVYLINENLQLILQQANFAALRGQQDLYTQQMNMAIKWLKTYYDTNNQAVIDMARLLKNLQQQKIASDNVLQFQSMDVWQSMNTQQTGDGA